MERGIKMIKANDMHKFTEESQNFYPTEVADDLLAFTYCPRDEKQKLSAQLTDAMYNLMANAQNEYNSDYWRVLWNVLQNVAEAIEEIH